MSSERGQDTAEWAGVLIVVAVVIAGVLLTNAPQAIGHGLVCGVHKVLGGSQGCAADPRGRGPTGGGPAPGDPWNSSDPVTQATWGTYVSLGDSYSAGEGLGDYQKGSSVHQSQCRVSVIGHCVYHKDPKIINGCDRSSYAYNSVVSDTFAFKGGKRTWACSGSTTKDIYDPNHANCSKGSASGKYGEGCQLYRVDPNTSLITMSIGGNDAGFSKELKSCYFNRMKLHWSKSCSYEAGDINANIAGIRPNLIADLKQLHRRAPHARIILITYPKLFRDPPVHNEGCVTFEHVCLTKGDQAFYNQEAVKLDNAICSDAAAAGVNAECINAANAFQGCEIGQNDSCVQAPDAHISGSSWVGTNQGAYHPTQRGQTIMGALVNEEIQDPPPGVGGH